MNRIELALLGLLPILGISCSNSTQEPSPEVRGDPRIVSKFDFAKAWELAEPTTGKIVPLNALTIVGTTVRYARSSHYHIFPASGYDYLDEVRDSSSLRPFLVAAKGIVNDLGDTIYYSHSEEYTSTGLQTSDAVIHIGVDMIYSHTTDYGGEGSMYLVSINGKSYDLMKTIQSTYRSIKYLRTIYPDSAIPFKVYESDPQ